MEQFYIRTEIYNLVQHFNETVFQQEVLNKEFLYNVTRSEKNLVRYIYSNGDIKFAANLIKLGANFDIGYLLPAMLRYDYADLRWHINDIRGTISQSEYHIVHDILDSWYSNNYIKQSSFIKYFYPPDILASATKTNSPEYIETIYNVYLKLYESESIIIRDILTISALIILQNPKSLILAPVVVDHSAIKYANCNDNGSTQSCLVPFHDFSNFEIGRFMHELTHFALGGLYHNKNNPYPHNDFIAQRGYEFASKQIISNITSLVKINFNNNIFNSNVGVVALKDALLAQKDILLYTIPDRMDDSTRVDLLSNIFFGNDIAISENSKEKYLRALYKSEIETKSISKSTEIALERIGDWITYPNDELNRELVARFVELHYRSKELDLTDELNAMMMYWPTITNAGEKLKDSSNLVECFLNYSEAVTFIEYTGMSLFTKCLVIGD